MASNFHKDLGTVSAQNDPNSGWDVHGPVAWTFADTAARTGATGFTPKDLRKFAIQTDDNTLWMLLTDTPTWVKVGGGGVALGFVFEEYVDDDSVDSTPSAAFVEATKLTTSTLPAGTYLISWSMEVKNDTLNGITRVRVQLDDVDDLAFVDAPIPVNIASEVAVAGHVRRVLGAGVHTIDIDFFPFAGTTAIVRRKRLNIKQVA